MDDLFAFIFMFYRYIKLYNTYNHISIQLYADMVRLFVSKIWNYMNYSLKLNNE